MTHIINTLDLDAIICRAIREAMIAAMPDRQEMLAVIYNAHYDAALPLLGAQDFNRAHWLSSFAVYTLTE